MLLDEGRELLASQCVEINSLHAPAAKKNCYSLLIQSSVSHLLSLQRNTQNDEVAINEDDAFKIKKLIFLLKMKNPNGNHPK